MLSTVGQQVGVITLHHQMFLAGRVFGAAAEEDVVEASRVVLLQSQLKRVDYRDRCKRQEWVEEVRQEHQAQHLHREQQVLQHLQQ